MLHAHQAIIIVQSTLLMYHLPHRRIPGSKQRAKNEDMIKESTEATKEFKDRISVLTIAYHNLAVEQEFMHMYYEAVASYQMARDFANSYLGTDDNISKRMSEIYEKAKDEIEIKMNKIKQSEEKLSQARNKQRAMSSSAKSSFANNHTYSKPRRNISMGMNATGGANRSRQKKM